MLFLYLIVAISHLVFAALSSTISLTSISTISQAADAHASTTSHPLSNGYLASLPETTTVQALKPVQTITETLYRIELKRRQWKSLRGSSMSKHHRPSPVRGSPHPKHVNPSPGPRQTVANQDGMPTEIQGTVLDTSYEASTDLIQRRWNAPQTSPTPKHRKPKPGHWGSGGHPEPTTATPTTDSHVPDSPYVESSSVLIHRRWNAPQGSPVSKHRKSEPGHWGSDGHPKPTPATSITSPRASDFLYEEGSSELVHRRWKSPHGSPSLKPTKSSHKSSSMLSSISGSPATTSVPIKFMSAGTSIASAAATSTTCTTVDPFGGTVPSLKDNSTGAFFRFQCGLSFQLAYECPYLCGYHVGEQLGQCFDQDNSISTPKDDDNSYTCTHCFYPSRKFAAGIGSNTSNCTSVDPSNPPCPPSTRFDNGTIPIRYQTACGTKASEITDCPYLCTAVDKPDQYHCENEDLGGTIFKPTGTRQMCVQCLPEC